MESLARGSSGKRKRWELICDEARHCGVSSAHTASLARAFRFPIDAQRVPGAMECQFKRDKTNRGARESCLLTKPSDTGMDYVHTTRSWTGLACRWSLSNAEFHPSSTCHFHFFTDCQVRCRVARATRGKKETLKMTNELGKFFVGLLYTSAVCNLARGICTILARILNIGILESFHCLSLQ